MGLSQVKLNYQRTLWHNSLSWARSGCLPSQLPTTVYTWWLRPGRGSMVTSMSKAGHSSCPWELKVGLTHIALRAMRGNKTSVVLDCVGASVPTPPPPLLLPGHSKMISFKGPETVLALVMFSSSSQVQFQAYHCHSYLTSLSLSFHSHSMDSIPIVGIKWDCICLYTLINKR